MADARVHFDDNHAAGLRVSAKLNVAPATVNVHGVEVFDGADDDAVVDAAGFLRAFLFKFFVGYNSARFLGYFGFNCGNSITSRMLS